MSLENAVKRQKVQAEIAQARKETSFYASRVEQAHRLEKKQERLEKKRKQQQRQTVQQTGDQEEVGTGASLGAQRAEAGGKGAKSEGDRAGLENVLRTFSQRKPAQDPTVVVPQGRAIGESVMQGVFGNKTKKKKKRDTPVAE